MRENLNEMKKGRIITKHYTKYIALYNNQKYTLEVSGRFKYIAYDRSDYPVVGDYVTFRETNSYEGIIEKVHERKSELKRLSVLQTNEAQLLAANIDVVFLCMSLNEDFNVKKLQNFLSLTYSKHYENIILLTKLDLCDDLEHKINQVKSVTDDEVFAVNSFDDEYIQSIEEMIGTRTAVFIGSSGVGKSTIINKLINDDYFTTNEVRFSDAQGRHTTVHRELIDLKSGGAVIDTPGIRIVNSYIIEDIESHFDDVLRFANKCKFRDCTHSNEPGCEVMKAIDNYSLTQERLMQYEKAVKLNEFNQRRESQKAKALETKNNKRR